MHQRTLPRPGLRFFLILILITTVLLQNSPNQAFAQNLDPLFAVASDQEKADVWTDWSQRPNLPSNGAIDRTATLNGFRMDRISFDFDGLHQYGLLRYPLEYTPGQKFPVLVLLHGGFNGLWFNDVLNFDGDFPSNCLADSFFVVCPTFRGEALSGGELGNVMSEGSASIWNRDVDDSMAMLTAVLGLSDDLDPNKVVVMGQSRGGNVAYQMAVRDPRVRRTVVLFGPSQFRVTSIQSEIQAHLDGTGELSGDLALKVHQKIVEPWLNGVMNLAEARHLLTTWSVCDFLPSGLWLETHHGLIDDRVPPEQSYLVAEWMAAFDGGSGHFALHTYANGQHNPATLDGYGALVEDFFCSLEGSVSTTPNFPKTGLFQTWPNPFEGHLTVLAEDSAKSLPSGLQLHADVFDLRGHRVSEFNLASGATSNWEARDLQGQALPSGRYHLRIRNHPQFPVQKVLLLR